MECLARGLQARCDPSEVIAELREHFQSMRQGLASLTNSFISGESAGGRAVWPARVFMRTDLVSSSALTHGLSSSLLASASGGLQHQTG